MVSHASLKISEMRPTVRRTHDVDRTQCLQQNLFALALLVEYGVDWRMDTADDDVTYSGLFDLLADRLYLVVRDCADFCPVNLKSAIDKVMSTIYH